MAIVGVDWLIVRLVGQMILVVNVFVDCLCFKCILKNIKMIDVNESNLNALISFAVLHLTPIS